MTWENFELTFDMKTPIHIGYHKIGLLQRTRYYLPGKNLWAAVTAILTPMLIPKPNSEDYKKIGDFLKNNLIFSYFFIKSDGEKLIPKFTSKGLMYGSFSEYKFEQNFIFSTPSTAITPGSNATEDGSLHEIEFINNKCKKSSQKLGLSGNLYVNLEEKEKLSLSLTNNEIVTINYNDSNVDLNNLLENGIFVGGENRYGFGFITLNEITRASRTNFKVFKNEPHIRLNKGKPIEAHLKLPVEKIEGLEIQGEIEAVSGRDWGKKGAGRQIGKSAFIAFSPGSIVNKKELFKITAYGVWEKN